jgi:hypothetical protein
MNCLMITKIPEGDPESAASNVLRGLIRDRLTMDATSRVTATD